MPTAIDLTTDRLLRVIAEGTASDTGSEFLRSLVRCLSDALDVRYAFIAEFAVVRTRVRTLAFWDGVGFLDNFEYELAGTPCEAILGGEMRLYTHGVQDLFPEHRDELAEIGAESYLAIPLTNAAAAVLGHLALIDVKPMTGSNSDLAVFRIFAARAAAELDRLQVESMRRQTEERLAAILASTMDAIVTVDTDRHVTLFNNAAERMFRCAREDMLGRRLDPLLSDPLRQLLDDALQPGADASRASPCGWVPEGLSAIRTDGDSFPIEVTVSPLTLAGRRHLTLILRDINERRKAEAELQRLQVENIYLKEQIEAPYRFEEMVGQSASMLRLFDELEQVAATDSTILVIGETGTGKERIAHAIHNLSPRKDRMLVKLNCAALPSELIESELFGHEKGAFTGATAQRKGRFELADGGTLFLDEVGELTLPAQAKLLRILQEQEFERVGGSQTIHVDVRVIAATNRNLAEAVKAGEFRADLYYRLNVFPVAVPPLRDRDGDIGLLARHLLERYARKLGKPISGFAPGALRRLEAYSWPGNVRELQNVIERATVLARTPLVEVDLPTEVDAGPAATVEPSSALALESVDRAHLLRVLEQYRWIIEGKTGAAAVLGLTPSTLRYRMQKLGIVRPK